MEPQPVSQTMELVKARNMIGDWPLKCGLLHFSTGGLCRDGKKGRTSVGLVEAGSYNMEEKGRKAGNESRASSSSSAISLPTI
jgi:hypothetical protein